MAGRAAAQRVDAQGLDSEIEVGAHEAVRPVGCDGDLRSEDLNAAAPVGAAQENDLRGRRPWDARSWRRSRCRKRCQTFACHRPLKLSTAAWKPVSRGGANTGMTPAARQNRMKRPSRRTARVEPAKRVALSACR